MSSLKIRSVMNACDSDVTSDLSSLVPLEGEAPTMRGRGALCLESDDDAAGHVRSNFSPSRGAWRRLTRKTGRFNQLLLIQPTTNAKRSLNRRDKNSSNDTRRC